MSQDQQQEPDKEPKNSAPVPRSSGDNPTRRIGFLMVALMWLVVLGLFTAYFTHWEQTQFNPNQTVTKMTGPEGVREVVLQRNRYGHYVATGAIDDQPVVFMLDTGASDISVPQVVATRLGLKRGPVVYYQTAAGPAKAYMTRLDSVTLGDIELRNVRAHINPNVNDDEVLLGMTFLKHLEFTQRGDNLTIRQYPQERI
jgi:aspartyl protease family protein